MTRPTKATLNRFTIDPTHLAAPITAQLFAMPRHLYDASKEVEEAVQNLTGKKYLKRPVRKLNNALMALCPLTHGFEFESADFTSYALAITPDTADPIDPRKLKQAIDDWMTWWIKSHTANNLTAQAQILKKWRKGRDGTLSADFWQKLSLGELLERADGSRTYVKRAIPSIIAALLHGKQSEIDGTTVHWYRVQDGGSKQLYVIGMAENQPFFARYTDLSKRTSKKKPGTGYFAFKLVFSLQDQSGRAEPWIRLDMHVQRYADKPLVRSNAGRNASLLVSANKFRIDNSESDATLIRLPIEYKKEKGWKWAESLSELIEQMGLDSFAVPHEIVAGDARKYWDASADEAYYLIHAEGYDYKGRKKGHELEAGLSMTQMADIRDAVQKLLPILQLDVPLSADSVQFPTPAKRPNALKIYGNWKYATGQRDLNEKDRKSRLDFQAVLGNALMNATDSKPVYFLTFTTDPDVQNGLQQALREAFMLDEGDGWPQNVFVQQRLIEKTDLFAPLDDTLPRQTAHAQRVAAWHTYLQTLSLPTDGYTIALVGLHKEADSALSNYGTHSAVREAFETAQMGVQMILPFAMEEGADGTLGFKRGNRDRAMQTAREMVMRHTGVMFGERTELFAYAGLDHPLDVIGFYLHSTNSGVQFPVAVMWDGQMSVRFPTQNEWVPYIAAAPLLGKLFASQWSHVEQKWGKPNLNKRSILYQSNQQLSRFIQDVLSDLSAPTLALIEADKWREQRTKRAVWPQLQTHLLGTNLQQLDFGQDGVWEISADSNLVAIIRIQSGTDTPQYITDTLRSFKRPHGLHETVGNVFHYYSIGGELGNAKMQQERPIRENPSMFGDKAAGVAYKHAQSVEFVPFFIKQGYDPIQLCRVPHLLRLLPHWKIGTPVLPYPIHLTQTLLEDQLTILTLDE